jgi:YfiH family protein
MTEYKTIGTPVSGSMVKLGFKGENAPECFMTLRSAGGMGKNTDPLNPERITILNKLGIKSLYTLKQTHSRTVFNTEDLKEGDTEITEGDGIYSNKMKKSLAVTVADCMPVFFYNHRSGVFGVLHSGWKGTGISLEVIKKISGGDPEDFEFILGPSIGPCCYQVDNERGKLFEELYGPGSVDVRDNSFYIDLRTANAGLLEKAGIRNITVYENCTCCDDNFYSFRGDGAKQFRLMLALIGYFR